ncbi:MAG: phosphatidylserine decarboxylase [Victivallaceae bacterium]|nr:phosphatidylserine decarboxylase [Victivallaceae bacterium]
MTLTRFGLREWGFGIGAALVVTVLLALIAWKFKDCGLWLQGVCLGGIVIALLGAVVFAGFFRNPKRTPPADPSLLISPADGTVRDITVLEVFDMAPFPEHRGKVLRIGIFLSVLNVHVNRVPAAMEVLEKKYRIGKYLDARNPACGRENEAMTISGTATVGTVKFPMAIRQISGAIARRIVCPVEPGRKLTRGEVYGMIKFGSRTELYLPAEDMNVMVKVGDKVKGGLTPLAALAVKK